MPRIINTRMNEENIKMLEKTIKDKRLKYLNHEVIDATAEELMGRLNLVSADVIETIYCLESIKYVVDKSIVKMNGNVLSSVRETISCYKKFRYLEDKKLIEYKDYPMSWQSLDSEETIEAVIRVGLGYLLKECSECNKLSVI